MTTENNSIDSLPISVVREIVRTYGPLFNSSKGAQPVSTNNPPIFWEIGKAYFIRTVTMAQVGRLVDVTDHEILLSCASWVADTGRFHTALKTGEFSEVEPFPHGVVAVGRGSIIDACEFRHTLPTTQK